VRKGRSGKNGLKGRSGGNSLSPLFPALPILTPFSHAPNPAARGATWPAERKERRLRDRTKGTRTSRSAFVRCRTSESEFQRSPTLHVSASQRQHDRLGWQLGAGDAACTQVVTPLEPSGGHHAGHQATTVPGDISYVLCIGRELMAPRRAHGQVTFAEGQ
jgi:hypothetical protein